jgi:YD repeat-containing protein
MQGFNELKGSVWSGALNNASPARISRSICRIGNTSGQTQAEFNIAQVQSASDAGFASPNPDYKTLTRGDGSVYVFKNNNGQWTSDTDQNTSLVQSGSQWVFTDSNNTRETYNSTGQLISTTTLEGRTTTLDYNIPVADGGDGDPDTLDRVTDASGQNLLFGYTDNYGSPRLSTVTTPDGVIGYRYDVNGNLEFIDKPDGTTRQYHYEDPGFTFALTGITDERGIRFATWAYNSRGKVILSEHAGGVEQVNLSYNPDGTTTVTDSRGATRTYNFTLQRGSLAITQITGDQCTTCLNGEKKNRSYNTNGYLSGYTDWGDAITKFGNHDSTGQYGCMVKGITVADTSTGECTFDPAVSPDARRFD